MKRIQTFIEFKKAHAVNEDWDAFDKPQPGENLVNAKPIKGRHEVTYNANYEDPRLEPEIIRAVSSHWWAIPYKDTLLVGAPDVEYVYVFYADNDYAVVDVLGCTPTGKFASIWPTSTSMEDMEAFISALVDPTLPYDKLMERHENSFALLCGEMGGYTIGGLADDNPWISQLFRAAQGLNESSIDGGVKTFGDMRVGDILYTYVTSGEFPSEVEIVKVNVSRVPATWATEMGGDQVKHDRSLVSLTWDGGYCLSLPADATYVEYGNFKSTYNNKKVLICATSKELLEEGKKFHRLPTRINFVNENRLYNASDDNVTVDCELAGELAGNPIKYIDVLQNKYGENIIGMMDYVVLCPVGSKTQVWIHKGAEFAPESAAEGANAAVIAGDVVPSALVNDPNYEKAMSIIRTFDADSEKGEQWYAYISAYYAELEKLA